MTYKKSILFVTTLAFAGVVAVGASTFARGEGGGVSGTSEMQKQKVEERKADITQKIEAKQNERTAKLESKRLETCEKRQARINAMFAKATAQNKKQLAVFQSIEEKVKAFYETKNIEVDGYDAAVLNADEKEATAVAAIEASQELTFDCASADATKPGAVVKEAVKLRHEALKAYRTAVKDLILVVKKHNGQNRSTTDGSPTDGANETQTENESTSGGGQ